MESINNIEKTYRRLAAEGRAPLKLFQGNPTLHGIHFPQSLLKEAYAEALEYPRYEPDPKGLRSAREAIAGWYAAENWKTDPENIILTSGTSESFFYLFNILSQPGDHFLAPLPTYPLFDHLAQSSRVDLRYYRLEEENNWQINLAQLQSLVDSRTRGVILISPHNPTGAVANRKLLEPLVAWCNQQKLPILCDEVFAPFFFGAEGFPRPAAITKPDLCFTLNGISKLLALPGMKLGWIAVSGKEDKVKQAVESLEILADSFLSVHDPIQRALPKLIADSRDFQKQYQQEILSRWEGTRGLLQQFPSLQWVPPQGGFYLTVRVNDPKGRSEEQWILDLMEQQGVFVHPGYFFDLEEGIHFVFTYLTETTTLHPALKKIGIFTREK